MLDVFTGDLQLAAETYDDFIQEVNKQWWQETYLFSELVFQLHETGKVPGPGQCYALSHTQLWVAVTRPIARWLIRDS